MNGQSQRHDQRYFKGARELSNSAFRVPRCEFACILPLALQSNKHVGKDAK